MGGGGGGGGPVPPGGVSIPLLSWPAAHTRLAEQLIIITASPPLLSSTTRQLIINLVCDGIGAATDYYHQGR